MRIIKPSKLTFYVRNVRGSGRGVKQFLIPGFRLLVARFVLHEGVGKMPLPMPGVPQGVP